MEMDITIPKGRGFTPFPFGQCAVCGAEATGNHYGANTCEGCKGFFKRSLPVFRSFRCFFGNKCDVSPDTRNRCKACRFRKCIEAGMALDAVKMGRIPKVVKEQALESTGGISRQTSSNSHQSSGSPGGSGDDSRSSETKYGSEKANSYYGGTMDNIKPGQSSTGPLRMPGGRGHVRFEPYGGGPILDMNDHHPQRRYTLPGVPVAHNSTDGAPVQRVQSSQRPEWIQTSVMQPGQRLAQPSEGLVRSMSLSRPEHSFIPPYPQPGAKELEGLRMKLQKVSEERLHAMAEMAINGDLNENHPDLKSVGSEVKADMATAETAVAVAEPELSGGRDCVPVVPRDVMVFLPGYVPADRIPESAHPKNRGRFRQGLMNDLKEGSSGMSDVNLPAVPTPKFFAQLNSTPQLKLKMCDHTFRMIATKNNEVYGEETRANEVFLKECVSTGNIPENQPERTPQQMRDILKDRLITQVKRVVQLSEAIPGFRSLDTSDQHSLLRTCILDVWMVHSARFLRDGQSYIIFLESNTFYARKWMEMFLTDEFLETVFNIALKINSLDLNFEELSLLKSILIVRPDRPGLKNVEYITLLHNHLLDALKFAIRNRRAIESSQLLDDLMELLKGWKILDVMQEKYVHPIDLSHFSQGPWKIGEIVSSAASTVSSNCPSPAAVSVGGGDS